MSTAIATINGHALAPTTMEFSNQQLEMIRHRIMPGASALEFDFFVNLCKVKRLDPLTNQIYAVKVGGKWQFPTGIDGLRSIAERSGNYGGQTEPYWCGPDGEWRDVWLEDGPPSAAKVGVWKRGCEHPTWGVATFRSYGKGKQNNWLTMPDLMLAKCAEALALRKAFPDDLSGLYVREEFGVDDVSFAPAVPVEAPESAPAGSYRRARGVAPPAEDEMTPEAAIRAVRDGKAEVVDAETGEIIETPEQVGLRIKGYREELGWDQGAVRKVAKAHNLDLGKLADLQTMAALLEQYVAKENKTRAEQAGDEDPVQGEIIDADVVERNVTWS